MLIIDYNGIAVSAVAIEKTLSEDLIRHMILNTIRMYKTKFSNYGEVVIAGDGANNWRRGAFPQYKANRRKNREESTFDWNKAFEIINKVREEIKENFPYKVIHIEGCEADDVIGTLVQQTQEFGQMEDVMIISADGDFKQLQQYSNVKQFSPLLKKFVVDDHPRLHLAEKIIKGDTGDGVPNIFSNDDVLVEGLRQTPATKKKITEVLNYLDSPTSQVPSWWRNWQRNEMLIDLTKTPENLREQIIQSHAEQDPWHNKGKVLPYLINNQCKMLIECIEEFI
jgi:hypothetical protein